MAASTTAAGATAAVGDPPSGANAGFLGGGGGAAGPPSGANVGTAGASAPAAGVDPISPNAHLARSGPVGAGGGGGDTVAPAAGPFGTVVFDVRPVSMFNRKGA
jgi:hypothetical protein